MPLNADQLLAVFPHPVLTKIIGKPNLGSITFQQSEHNGNLASIKSNLWDGLTGLMVLSMKPDIFKTIHPNAFVIPTNPGPAPDPAVIAAAYTVTKIADIYKAYALESAIYAEYATAERISVKLALDSMSELYYNSLKNAYTGYAGVTLRQLLGHLVTTYAAINQFDLEKNKENMMARYNPNAPIETLFAQIADGVAYAELGDAPFTSKQVVDIALLCLAKTGVFNDDLKEWNRLPLLNRTWPKFRVHFAKAHCEWRANLRLTVGQHFSRANAVDSTNVKNHQAKTVGALANIATTTAADRDTVATCTDTISQLSSELASAQAKLISSLLDNQRLLKRLSYKGGSWNTSRGVTNRKTSGGGAAGPWYGPSIHYCHTHGHKCPHPSFKCSDPGTGHIKNVTKKDTRGGSEREYKKK